MSPSLVIDVGAFDAGGSSTSSSSSKIGIISEAPPVRSRAQGCSRSPISERGRIGARCASPRHHIDTDTNNPDQPARNEGEVGPPDRAVRVPQIARSTYGGQFIEWGRPRLVHTS